MLFVKKIFFISIFIINAFGMGGGVPGAGPSIAGIYRDVKDVEGLAHANSPEANKLRTNLSMLAAKLAALGGSTPGQLVSAANAQQVSATVDSVINMLLGTAALSSVQTVEAVKGGIANNPYLQALFINQGNNPSVWDTYMYPQMLTAFIRVQSSYAAAILNYISQNISRLTSGEIESLNNSVQALLNRLNSLA
ncbi:MAG: hypothetical protein ACK5PQ_00090 [Alphaproteobacteria bacterium]